MWPWIVTWRKFRSKMCVPSASDLIWPNVNLKWPSVALKCDLLILRSHMCLPLAIQWPNVTLKWTNAFVTCSKVRSASCLHSEIQWPLLTYCNFVRRRILVIQLPWSGIQYANVIYLSCYLVRRSQMGVPYPIPVTLNVTWPCYSSAQVRNMYSVTFSMYDLMWCVTSWC